MDSKEESIIDTFATQELVKVAIRNNLKRLKYKYKDVEIEIEPNFEAIHDEEKLASTLEAQEIAAKLMKVSDDKLLDNPYAGLEETLESIDNETKE